MEQIRSMRSSKVQVEGQKDIDTKPWPLPNLLAFFAFRSPPPSSLSLAFPFSLSFSNALERKNWKADQVEGLAWRPANLKNCVFGTQKTESFIFIQYVECVLPGYSLNSERIESVQSVFLRISQIVILGPQTKTFFFIEYVNSVLSVFFLNSERIE